MIPPERKGRVPSRIELEAARSLTIPDVLAPGLRVLFVGINPGLVSGATGHHFARPGNRFWATLHGAGFTPRVLAPEEDATLPTYELGVTNLVPRTTAVASELTSEELRAGGLRLREVVERVRPRFVAFVGVSSYRVAFDRPKASIGRQADRLGDAVVWVLPNPSGLNAHYQLPQLIPLFRALRDAAFGDIVAGATTSLHPQPESPMPEFPPDPWEDSLIADIRANGGRPSSGPLAGHPLLLLYSTGAKSGQRRRSILTYSRDGDDYIVAGTASGAPKDPAWVANVRANPDVTIEVAGVEHPAKATIVDETERQRLWDHHVEELPWFGDYPKQTTRTIPVIRLRTSS